MSVYVDPAVWPYGRMMMCHMIADSTDELLAMADRVGVDRKWIQKAGTHAEHFDISKGARESAVRNGAIEVDSKTLLLIIDRRSPAPRFPAKHSEIRIPTQV
jgi:hypothetical protein